MIYSGQVEDYKLLAETISYKVYFYNAEDKKGTFYRFANEKRYDTIVATSAFRTGIDIPYIRWVIHIGEPRTLFDYSQKSSRAGRDRKISQVIVIRDRIKG